MNILPSKINTIYFKGTANEQSKAQQNGSAKNFNVQNSISANPTAAAQINLKPPMAYKKLTEFTVPECENKAEVYKLANGQRIVILPKNGPTVVRTYFNVGSMNEPDNLRGISHYIEHNLFNGTEKLKPGEFFKKVSDLGAYTNAMTGFDQTNYFIQSQLLEEDYLKKIFELHSDQLQNPIFAQEQLIKEKGPVTSEISMYADDPSNYGQNIMLKNLFGIKSTSADLVAGSIQNINNVTREDVVNYYNTWYTPDNAVTIVTGDVNSQEVMELASKNFTKKLSPKPETKKYEELNPLEKTTRVDSKRPNCNSAVINMGFVGPENNNTKDKIALDIVSTILSYGSNARFAKALESLQTGAGLYSEKIGNKSGDKQAIIISSNPADKNCEETIKSIYSEISKLTTTAPPTQQEIDAAKEKLKMVYSNSIETSLGVNEFIGQSFLDNDSNYLVNYKNILNSITPQDIINVTKKYLDLNKTSISVVHPQSSTTEQIRANYTKANQAKQISFGSKPTANINDTFYDVKQYRLNNNMEVAIKPTKSEFVSCDINLKSQTLINLSSPQMEILTQLLNRGSLYKDNETYNSIKDNNNINISLLVSPEGINIYSKSHNSKAKETLNLIKENLYSPRFTQEDFEIAKKQYKNALECSKKSAGDNLYEALFPDIKMFESKEKQLKELENLSLNDIINTYNSLMSNLQGRVAISVPTDSNSNLNNEILSSLSKDFQAVQPAILETKKTYTPNTSANILTQVEQKNQAEVIQSYKYKYSENIDDIAKIKVLNTILGGNSTSRLFNDLRESQKLAYHVSSYTDQLGDTGLINLLILTTTDDNSDPSSSPQNINKSLDGFKKHIQKLKTEPVSEEELKKAKLMLKNNILNSVETLDGKLGAISKGQNSPYGITERQEFLNAIEKITTRDIQNAANYIFAGEPITSIVASQKSLDESILKKD